MREIKLLITTVSIIIVIGSNIQYTADAKCYSEELDESRNKLSQSHTPYPISTSDIAIVDHNNIEEELTTDVKYFVILEVNNETDLQQEFVYLVQVKDSVGIPMLLEMQWEAVEPYERAKVSIDWIPFSTGCYSVETFIWDDLENPYPLVASQSKTVIVVFSTADTYADLSISKLDSLDPLTAGNELTYTIVVSNDGPSDAQNVQVTDMLPVGLILISVTSSQGSCTNFPCSLGKIANDESTTITVTATVDPSTPAGTIISNTVSVTSSTSDPDTSNNLVRTITTVDASANLHISVSDNPDPVTAGSELTYTIIVTNNGPSDAQNVQVIDIPSPALTLVNAISSRDACTNFPCSLGNIANGASATITVTATVDPSTPAGTIISNTVSVTSSTSDPDNSNNSDTEVSSLQKAKTYIERGWDPSFLIRRIATVNPNNAETYFESCPDTPNGRCYPDIPIGQGFWTLSTEVGGIKQPCKVNTQNTFIANDQMQPCPFSFSWLSGAATPIKARLDIDNSDWTTSHTKNIWIGFNYVNPQGPLYVGGNTSVSIHINNAYGSVKLAGGNDTRSINDPNAQARYVIGMAWFAPNLNKSIDIEFNLGNIPMSDGTVQTTWSSTHRIARNEIKDNVHYIYLGGRAWGLPDVSNINETKMIVISWPTVIHELINDGILPQEAISVNRPTGIIIGIEQKGRLHSWLDISELIMRDVVS